MNKEIIPKLEQKHQKKYRDEGWDFRGENTKQYTHCFHSYPAMMIPQVAGKILDEFAKNVEILFDPYCGTGTSLVEANIRGINAIGTDINPLARLIAKVKTTVVPLKSLDRQLNDFSNFVLLIKLGAKEISPSLPKFKNIDYWFKKDTQLSLATIKEYIDNINDKNIQNFFKVAFSEVVREASLTRNGEFKLYRMPINRVKKFNPDVLSIMITKLFRNRKGMEEYVSLKKNNARSLIFDFNTVYGINKDILPLESIDIVMTSPPYGDSRTTVAYGQFSRLANQWLGIKDANEIDKRSMGGIRQRKFLKFQYDLLDETLKKIAEKDDKRVYDVISFYSDYKSSIEKVSKVVKRGGIVAYVVGNRRVKGIEIPNDEITREFFERNGFKHIETIIRKIPSKKMPKANSPTNVAGKTDNTINFEYIVILRKM